MVPAGANAKPKRAYSIRDDEEARKWPGGVLRYKWFNEDLKIKKNNTWLAAVQLWKDAAPFLEVVEGMPPNPTLGGVGEPIILIESAVFGHSVSFSPIGTAGRSQMNMIGLGDCKNCSAHYAHEIGHSEFSPQKIEYRSI